MFGLSCLSADRIRDTISFRIGATLALELRDFGAQFCLTWSHSGSTFHTNITLLGQVIHGATYFDDACQPARHGIPAAHPTPGTEPTPVSQAV